MAAASDWLQLSQAHSRVTNMGPDLPWHLPLFDHKPSPMPSICKAHPNSTTFALGLDQSFAPIRPSLLQSCPVFWWKVQVLADNGQAVPPRWFPGHPGHISLGFETCQAISCSACPPAPSTPFDRQAIFRCKMLFHFSLLLSSPTHSFPVTST